MTRLWLLALGTAADVVQATMTNKGEVLFDSGAPKLCSACAATQLLEPSGWCSGGDTDFPTWTKRRGDVGGYGQLSEGTCPAHAGFVPCMGTPVAAGDGSVAFAQEGKCPGDPAPQKNSLRGCCFEPRIAERCTAANIATGAFCALVPEMVDTSKQQTFVLADAGAFDLDELPLGGHAFVAQQNVNPHGEVSWSPVLRLSFQDGILFVHRVLPPRTGGQRKRLAPLVQLKPKSRGMMSRDYEVEARFIGEGSFKDSSVYMTTTFNDPFIGNTQTFKGEKGGRPLFWDRPGPHMPKKHETEDKAWYTYNQECKVPDSSMKGLGTDMRCNGPVMTKALTDMGIQITVEPGVDAATALVYDLMRTLWDSAGTADDVWKQLFQDCETRADAARVEWSLDKAHQAALDALEAERREIEAERQRVLAAERQKQRDALQAGRDRELEEAELRNARLRTEQLAERERLRKAKLDAAREDLARRRAQVRLGAVVPDRGCEEPACPTSFKCERKADRADCPCSCEDWVAAPSLPVPKKAGGRDAPRARPRAAVDLETALAAATTEAQVDAAIYRATQAKLPEKDPAFVAAKKRLREFHDACEEPTCPATPDCRLPRHRELCPCTCERCDEPKCPTPGRLADCGKHHEKCPCSCPDGAEATTGNAGAAVTDKEASKETSAAKKKSGVPLWLLIGGPILGVVLLGGIGYACMSSRKSPPPSQPWPEQGAQPPPQPPQPPQQPQYPPQQPQYPPQQSYAPPAPAQPQGLSVLSSAGVPIPLMAAPGAGNSAPQSGYQPGPAPGSAYGGQQHGSWR